MTIVFHCEHIAKRFRPRMNSAARREVSTLSAAGFIPRHRISWKKFHWRKIRTKNDGDSNCAETFRVQQQLNDHKEAPEQPGGQASPTGGALPISDSESELPRSQTAVGGSSGTDVRAMVGQYLVLMSREISKRRNSVRNRSLPGGSAAKRIVEQMAMQDVLEPELANVPPSVISGYFKSCWPGLPGKSMNEWSDESTENRIKWFLVIGGTLYDLPFDESYGRCRGDKSAARQGLAEVGGFSIWG